MLRSRNMFPNVSDKTIQNWFSFCRDICIKKFENYPVIFSFFEVKCEAQINEYIFCKRRKYHNWKPSKDTGLLVFLTRKITNATWKLEIIQNRSQSTLENIIINHVDKYTKSTIVSEWKMIGVKLYRGLILCIVYISDITIGLNLT